ncbi:prepilin-type N-terminal cleavage/methylation domain protein [Collimonas arenae]|uniref:Prepilin-type N-terminal cleavage/methylation domain protein n=1 Tax=Collimonas arenae TaxID=279058 RepID=A0A127QNZ6_9BURK|nr:prepilin-type N-terminal cleavage/methylation domain-containing protein [Collimonas arenae]AMP01922.1 prepilin-type N-terminal cleavage/methylation domain protein [Collimonas arenae]AMP11820.1 prepilin-type N-terminal cleavage/methylation domain protein [Collimonas arenae]
MCVNRAPQKSSAGFTLVEMIIAITILAMVAILGWRGLDGIVRSRIALTTEMEQTRGMQLTFAQLQSDCAQLAPASLMLTRPTLLATQDRLLMVRQVFAEQQPTRVQVIDYRLRNGVLTRQESLATRDLNVLDGLWQSALNDAGDHPENSQAVTLQSDLASMQMQLWGSDGQGWRPPAAASAGSQDTGSNANQWTGLQVALQLRGHNGSMLKTFLLGAA